MNPLFTRIALLAVLSLWLLPTAKAQSLVWAQAIVGSSTSASGTAVSKSATDTAGNLYSIGWFGGTADFDRGAGVYNLTAVSNLDMFVLKEDPSGSLIWVKQVKGLSSGVWGCAGRMVDVDEAGNIFITGTFRDSSDFDPGPAVYKLNSYGGYHAFVLKLDSAGNFVWVRDIGTQVPAVGVSANAAGRDKEGYLYFAALVNGNGTTPIDVDPGPGVYDITPVISDLLLEKLDSNGNFIWAKLIMGNNGKTPFSVALDSASNVFVSGKFLGSADFDPGSAVYTLTAIPSSFPGSTDIFVAKYDSAGNFGWAHSFGSSSDDAGNGGTVDRFGNVLVTGSFGGTVDFDPGPGVYNLTSASTRNSFALRLTNNGDFSWVNTLGGVTAGTALATDDTGNVYATAELSGAGTAVQKLDSAGNYIWSAYFDADEHRWIGLDHKDSIYISGDFSGANKDFDPGPSVYLLSGQSTRSGFIVKLNQTLLPTGVADASLQAAAVSVYPNPSSGIVTFSAPATIQHMEITDLTGKVVYRAAPAQMQTEINLGGKAAGIYFYEVDCGAGKQRGKLVVY